MRRPLRLLFPALVIVATTVSSAAGPSSLETRYETGTLASRERRVNGRRVGRLDTWWPDGTRRSSVEYFDDVFHGEYRTWTLEGRPYELKHFVSGREDGLQQAWDNQGVLYLNYEVRGGRHYGLTNAKPCLPAANDGTSEVRP